MKKSIPSPVNNARIMAIDFGSKRIGIALSDLLGVSAQPFKVLLNSGKKNVLQEITAIVAEQNVQEIIVGFPKNMNGTIGERALLSESFAESLRIQFSEKNIAIKLWDERLTTCEAEKVLINADVRRGKRKNVIDKIAAVLILQGYLSAKNKGEN